MRIQPHFFIVLFFLLLIVPAFGFTLGGEGIIWIPGSKPLNCPELLDDYIGVIGTTYHCPFNFSMDLPIRIIESCSVSVKDQEGIVYFHSPVLADIRMVLRDDEGEIIGSYYSTQVELNFNRSATFNITTFIDCSGSEYNLHFNTIKVFDERSYNDIFYRIIMLERQDDVVLKLAEAVDELKLSREQSDEQFNQTLPVLIQQIQMTRRTLVIAIITLTVTLTIAGFDIYLKKISIKKKRTRTSHQVRVINK